jgi:hypothetical protein
MTWRNWGDHPIIVMISVIGVFGGIIALGFTIYDHSVPAGTNQPILTPSNETKTDADKSRDHSIQNGSNQPTLTPSDETKTDTDRSRKESLSSDELKILTGDNSYSPISFEEFFKKSKTSHSQICKKIHLKTA